MRRCGSIKAEMGRCGKHIGEEARLLLPGDRKGVNPLPSATLYNKVVACKDEAKQVRKNKEGRTLNMCGEKKQRKDRSVTVRFSQKEVEALANIATEYNTTLSDVVRCAASGELDKYLGRLKYVDPKQGKVINSNIVMLGNAIMETRDHLRRIGVNFNQVARRVNAGEMQALHASGMLVSKEKLDEITRRVEKATKEAGEIVLFIAG